MKHYQGTMQFTKPAGHHLNYNGYEIKPGARWIFRALWRVMIWSGALRRHVDAVEFCHSVSIDRDKAISIILREAEGLLLQHAEMGLTRIIIGGPQLRECVAEAFPAARWGRITFKGEFSMPGERRSQYDRGLSYRSPFMGSDKTVVEIPIEVVPWFDGVLVL